MSKYTHQSFKNFVIELVEKNKLSSEQLSKILGISAAQDLLDVNNRVNTVNLHGQNTILEEDKR